MREYIGLYEDEKTGIAVAIDSSSGMMLSIHPNIHHTGSVKEMKSKGYWNPKDRIRYCYGSKYNIDMRVVYSEIDKEIASYCNCEACLERRR